MRLTVRLRALTVLLLLASLASAQDTEAIANPHPLRVMLTEQMRAQQMLAAQRMVDVLRALQHAQRLAYIDTDGDGVGEFPTLPEALGLVQWRGSSDAPAGVIGWGDAILHAGGVVETSGYLYRVVLPNAALGAAATLADVDANHAEREALIYGWPVRNGISGRWTFGAHVTRGALLATRTPTYSGEDSPPPDDAVLDPEGDADGRIGLSAPLLERIRGRDGSAWGPARDFIVQLPADELGLGGEQTRQSLSWAIELARLRTPAWEAICDAGGLLDDHPFVESRTPPIVRVSTPAEVTDAIATELRYPMERTGQWERQAASFQLVGATTPAKYVAADNVILFCPETLQLVCAVEGIDASRIEDVAKVLLAHECVHAFDFQTYPLQAALRDCGSEAGIAAWSAVVEGHAQQVTRRVTTGKKLEPAFAELLALNAPPSTDDTSVPPEARAALASLSFPYHDGEQFMDAVLAARGTAGVAAVLLAPPARPMLIETPKQFLARDDGPATPWEEITEPLANLEAPGSDVQRTPVLRRTLLEMMAAAPRIDAEAIVAGVVDVESRVSAAPDGHSQCASTVLLCTDARSAHAYVAASRALQSAQDAAYEANPLVEPDVRYSPPTAVEGAQAGYRVRKILRSAGGDVHGMAISVAAGPWVVEAAITRTQPLGAALERDLIRAVERTLKRASQD